MQYKKHKYLEQKQDLRGIMQDSNYILIQFSFKKITYGKKSRREL